MSLTVKQALLRLLVEAVVTVAVLRLESTPRGRSALAVIFVTAALVWALCLAAMASE